MSSAILQAKALTVPIVGKPDQAITKSAGQPISGAHDARRTRPMRVLNLGLFRTGTSSLREALAILGFAKVYHMSYIFQHKPADSAFWLRAFDWKYRGRGQPLTREDWDTVLGDCDAVSDFPCAAFSEELIAAYPEAKVVLTVRDSPAVWYESVLRTVWYVHTRSPFAPGKLLGRPEFDRLLPNLFRMGKRMFGDVFQRDFPRTGLAVYEQHNERIRQLVPEERLLIFNVTQGWTPLCDFLGSDITKGVDERQFPCVNAGQAVVDMVLAKQAAVRRSMLKVIAAVLVGLYVLFVVLQKALRVA